MSATDAAAPTAAPSTVRTGPRAKVPTILQMEIADCGAASLGMILAAHGRWVTLDELRAACGVSRDGATALDILAAAEGFGMEGDGGRYELAELTDVTMPVIAWWNRNHFLVLEGIDGRTAHLNDPARGRRSIPLDEFAAHYSGVVLSFTVTDEFTPGGEPPRLWPSIRSRVSTSASGLALATLAGTLATAPTLTVALLSRLFVDEVISQGDRSLAWWIVAAICLAVVAKAVLVQLQYRALAALQHKLAMVGTVDLLDRMLHLPLSAYFLRGPGDLANRMTSPGALAQTLSTQLGGVVVGSVSFVLYGVAMLLLDWRLASVVLAVSLLGLAGMRRGMRRQQLAQEVLLQAQGATQTVAVRSIAGIESIKASGASDDAFTGWVGKQVASIDAQRRLGRTASVVGAIPSLVTALTALSVLVGGGLLIDHGVLTFGGLLAFQFIASSLAAPVQQVLSSAASLQQGLAQVRRIEDITGQRPDPRFDDPPGRRETGPFTGRVELAGVSYGYRPQGAPLLRDVSLDLAPGRWVALVGVSGAGKTTIARIAAGIVGPWSGDVLFDGLPLCDWDPVSLAAGMASVDQQVSLFAGTVRENVTLWDPTIGDNRIVRALADSCVLDDVLARAGGLDATVLDAGRNFSGGQQQRLVLARALVREPRFLVLDEATAALDPITEVAVMDAVRRRGCTVLVVAHRLSTVRDADEIVCLGRGGQVLERGTHDELLAADGWYATSVRASGDGGVGD